MTAVRNRCAVPRYGKWSEGVFESNIRAVKPELHARGVTRHLRRHKYRVGNRGTGRQGERDSQGIVCRPWAHIRSCQQQCEGGRNRERNWPTQGSTYRRELEGGLKDAA